MPGLDGGLEPVAADDQEERFVLDAFLAQRRREREPLSGPSTKKAVERMSATSADGATTVTEPKSGAGSPVRGSRMWPIRRPSTTRPRSELPEVEAERLARPSSAHGLLAIPRIARPGRATAARSRRCRPRGPGRRDRGRRPPRRPCGSARLGEVERVALAPGALVDAGLGREPGHGAGATVDAKVLDARCLARRGELGRRRHAALAAQVPGADQRKDGGIEGARGCAATQAKSVASSCDELGETATGLPGAPSSTRQSSPPGFQVVAALPRGGFPRAPPPTPPAPRRGTSSARRGRASCPSPRRGARPWRAWARRRGARARARAATQGLGCESSRFNSD